MSASNTPRYFCLWTAQPSSCSARPAVAGELLAACGVVVQVTDRAREVFRIARLVELERAVVAQLGDGPEPARDHG